MARTSTTRSGTCPQFAADTTDVLRVLDIEHRSLQALVHDGGTVFTALTQSQSSLRNLVTSAGATFADDRGQQ